MSTVRTVLSWAGLWAGVVVSSSCASCFGDPVVVYDAFAATPDVGARDDVLHRYAAAGLVPLSVRCDDVDADELSVDVTNGIVEVEPQVDGDVVSLSVRVDDADATLTLTAGDRDIAPRALPVAAPAELEVSLTAPDLGDDALPAVDPGALLVFSPGTAALRTKLVDDQGSELFAVDAVRASAGSQLLTFREDAVGCARNDCQGVRGAVELSLADALGDDTPLDVSLAAGAATLALQVIPTTDDALTDVVLHDGASGDARAKVAVVLAGTAPVLGAPVVWTADGAELDGRGDLLRFDPASASHAVEASVGGLSATTTVAGENLSVTSVSAACGAAPHAAAPLAALSLLLAHRARRRRR